jgi:uncharacterized damage-inducible protein DinB
MDKEVHNLLVQQFNLRVYEESIPRIIKVCDLLSHDQIWHKQNENSNSIGHLILHLCGNVTQWIGCGVGQFPDSRNRKLEFTTSDLLSKEALKTRLMSLKAITDASFKTLKIEALPEIRNVQGFNESVLGIIIHVIEHFSYHTGQIAVIAKFFKNTDLGFYENLDLDITS